MVSHFSPTTPRHRPTINEVYPILSRRNTGRNKGRGRGVCPTFSIPRVSYDGKFKCDTGGKRLKTIFQKNSLQEKKHSAFPSGWLANVRSREKGGLAMSRGERQMAEGVRKGVEVRKPEA